MPRSSSNSNSNRNTPPDDPSSTGVSTNTDTNTGTDTITNDMRPEKRTQATLWDAVKSLSLRDFTAIHKVPCAREAFLAGIGAGFAFGGVKLVMKGTISSAANWAVGTFCGTSVVVYEACHIRRYKERVGMQRAVEVMERQARRKGKDAPPPPQLAGPAAVVKLKEEDVVLLPDAAQADEPSSPGKVAVPPSSVHGGGSRAKTTGSDGGREDEKPKKSWYQFW